MASVSTLFNSESDFANSDPGNNYNFRESFRKALVEVLKTELELENSVFLEGLGQFKCLRERRRESFRGSDLFAFRSETALTLQFEKCLESNCENTNSNIIETHALAKKTMAKLSIADCLGLSERELRKHIRTFFKDLKTELVTCGVTNLLHELGIFYAFSNSDAGTVSDLYHSAEIFFEARFKHVLECSETNLFETPRFYNAWEPLETAFGEPIKKWQINLIETLVELGFDPESSALSDIPEISIVAFANNTATENKAASGSLIYCTDGLRCDQARSSEQLFDQELTCQIEIPAEFSMSSEAVPDWPLRILTLGWILLHGFKNRSLREGITFTHQQALNQDPRSRIDTIVTTEFNKLPGVFIVEDIPYRYINLVGITQDEARLASDLSPYYLIQILKFKDLSQITRPQRMSFAKRRNTAE